MAQVPYQPVPEAQPSSQGVRLGEAPVTPEAFGVNIAQAVEGFGSTLEKSGSELANRALAIQHDRNIADADAADVEFMKQAGLEHAAFSTLEGKARLDAFPDHIKKLEDIRTRVGASLTNVDATNLYNRQSRNTLGRTIFSAARESATGQRQYEKQTNEAWLGTAIEQYSNDPTPARLEDIDRSAKELSVKITGGSMNDVVATEAANKAVSHALMKRVQTLSQTDAPNAKTFMEDNWNKLNADDKKTAQQSVISSATSQGSELIAKDIQEQGMETPTKGAMTLNEKEAEARRRVKEMDPKGTLKELEKATIAAVQQKHMIQNRADKEDAQRNVSEAVGLVTSKDITSLEEFKQDPKGYSIYNQMDPNLRDKQITGIVNGWFGAKDKADNSNNYKVLRSMASSNTDAFMQTSPGDWKVSTNDWKSLMTIRDRILRGNGQYNDPRVNRAMSWLTDKYGQNMEDQHVIGKLKDPKTANLFRGTLAVAIDQWQEDHPGKPLTPKDVQETIWGQMRGEKHEERAMDIFGVAKVPYWFDKTTPNWKQQISRDPQFREQLKQEIMKRRTTTYEPTDDELRNEWLRMVWKTFSPSYNKSE